MPARISKPRLCSTADAVKAHRDESVMMYERGPSHKKRIPDANARRIIKLRKLLRATFDFQIYTCSYGNPLFLLTKYLFFDLHSVRNNGNVKSRGLIVKAPMKERARGLKGRENRMQIWTAAALAAYTSTRFSSSFPLTGCCRGSENRIGCRQRAARRTNSSLRERTARRERQVWRKTAECVWRESGGKVRNEPRDSLADGSVANEAWEGFRFVCMSWAEFTRTEVL